MKTENAQHNNTIDIIKAFGIILVLITHYSWTEEQQKCFLFPYLINMAIPAFMIITGYVYSLSLSKGSIKKIDDAYNLCIIRRRFCRYTIPFVVVLIWELVDVRHFDIICSMNPLEIVKWILQGTAGPGSYYYPVMIQIVFLFPVVFFIIERKKGKR